jgi:phosphatidylglycerophosphate synthase
MQHVALLYAHHAAAGTDEPLAVIEVTGVASLHRQARQAARAGVSRILVMVERMSPGVAAAVEAVRRDFGAVDIVRAGDELANAIADDDIVLSIDEGLVADERAIAAVMAADDATSTLAVWRDADSRPVAAECIAANLFFAGVARYPGRLVRTVAVRLGDWDMQSTLLRAALGAGDCTMVEVGAIPTYCPARRRDVPLQWTRVTDARSAQEATDAALAAAQKGVLDWPARFLHPPVENMLTRLLLPTAMTPNLVSIGVFVLGLVALALFAVGQLWAGLVLALAIGPLDGVDGKLARTRVEFSKWGDLEHVADKIVEYGWFAALAYHFAAVGHGGAWALAAIIVLFALAEAVQGEFFRRFTGRQIDDAGDFERRFRLIGGRRNTFFWTLVPFAAVDAWYAGFTAIAVYSAATFFVTQARFFRRMREYGTEHSAQVAANFDKTAYAFLSAPKSSAK